nr:hypothetical protein [uncultured Pseudomonas sp.]
MDMRSFEVSYSKGGKQETFTVEQEFFSDEEAWGAIVEKLNIPLLDKLPGEPANTNRSLAEGAGVSGVTWREL